MYENAYWALEDYGFSMARTFTTHASFFSQEGVDFFAMEMEQFHFWRWMKLKLILDAVIYNHINGQVS